MKAIAACYAKINLTLDVKGKDGGYHLLSSLAVSAPPCDYVSVRLRTDGKIVLSCPGVDAPPEKNNAYRAAALFFERMQAQDGIGAGRQPGCTIEIEKNIPLMGGMGGSSADECGVIAALEKLTGFAPEGMGSGLTSDGAFMSVGGAGIMEGRGEKVRFLPYVPLYLVLLPGKTGVLTAECFALADRMERQAPGTEQAEKAYLAGDLFALGKALKNDLYPAAARFLPEIGERWQAVRNTGALGVSMSGSGSTVFGLYENPASAKAAAECLKTTYPQVLAVQTVPRGVDVTLQED